MCRLNGACSASVTGSCLEKIRGAFLITQQQGWGDIIDQDCEAQPVFIFIKYELLAQDEQVGLHLIS